MLVLEAFSKRAEKLLQLLAELHRRLGLRLADASLSCSTVSAGTTRGLIVTTHAHIHNTARQIQNVALCTWAHLQFEPLNGAGSNHVPVPAASKVLATQLKASLPGQEEGKSILPSVTITPEIAPSILQLGQSQSHDLIKAFAGEGSKVAQHCTSQQAAATAIYNALTMADILAHADTTLQATRDVNSMAGTLDIDAQASSLHSKVSAGAQMQSGPMC